MASMIFFHIEEKLTIESARKLAIQTAKEFLAHINANERIRNELVEYPLTEKYIHIAISGEDIDANDSTYIKSVNVGMGRLFYYIDSRKPPTFGIVLKETFREAEKIVREQSIPSAITN